MVCVDSRFPSQLPCVKTEDAHCGWASVCECACVVYVDSKSSSQGEGSTLGGETDNDDLGGGDDDFD